MPYFATGAGACSARRRIKTAAVLAIGMMTGMTLRTQESYAETAGYCMRSVQYKEAGAEESARRKSEVLSEIVDDLKNHYDTVWIAASQDWNRPLIVIGVNKSIDRLRDRHPLERFVSEWIALWDEMYKEELDVWLVNSEEAGWQIEFDLLIDKRIGMERSMTWMASRFFKPDPFGDSGDELIKGGLEENEVELEKNI